MAQGALQEGETGAVGGRIHAAGGAGSGNPEAARRGTDTIPAFLERRLKLRVNADKSAVARPWERKFLGYSMTRHREPKLRIAELRRKRFAEKVRKVLRVSRGQSLKQVIENLNPRLSGWMSYFRLTEVKGVLEELDGWIRHKLWTLQWRQWKRNHTRAQHLMRAGLSEARAWQSATNGRGPWWNGDASHMHAALPKSYFDRMGLVSLLVTQRRFSWVS
jgi:RNA-directed DNA polymerase